jgi:hypothetical protein
LISADNPIRAVRKTNACHEVRTPPQEADGGQSARPHRHPVERAEGGMGWLRLLRCDRDVASEGLCIAHFARRAICDRQRGTELPLVQYEQVQRRGDQLDAAKKA